jgi:hypothetical protein
MKAPVRRPTRLVGSRRARALLLLGLVVRTLPLLVFVAAARFVVLAFLVLLFWLVLITIVLRVHGALRWQRPGNAGVRAVVPRYERRTAPFPATFLKRNPGDLLPVLDKGGFLPFSKASET